MLVVPKRLLEVPVDVPNPKPVLVEEVAGWLNVVEPNNPPEEEETINHLPSPTAEGVLQVWFVAAGADGWLWVSPPFPLSTSFFHTSFCIPALYSSRNTAVPGLVCVVPKRPPVLLLDPKADVPNAPPLVVPKPASGK